MENVNKGVRIQNNDLMIPTQHYVRDYAEKMYNVENAININIDQQKFPYFVTTNKNTEFTFKEMIRKIRKGEFAIFSNKNITLDDVNVFDLKVPYVADKLNQYKYELEREILTFFGLNNNFEKKERLLVDEINSNNDFIDRNVEIMYKSRIEACKVINEIYGYARKLSKDIDVNRIDRITVLNDEIVTFYKINYTFELIKLLKNKKSKLIKQIKKIDRYNDEVLDNIYGNICNEIYCIGDDIKNKINEENFFMSLTKVLIENDVIGKNLRVLGFDYKECKNLIEKMEYEIDAEKNDIDLI